MPPTPGPGPIAAELEAHRQRRRAIFYPKTDSPLEDAVLRSLRTGAAEPAVDGIAEACRSLLGERPSSVVPLAEQGTFHRLYRATLAGGPVIVRTNALPQLGRDFALLTDRWAMVELHLLGLPSLRVHAVDISRGRLPFDVEILEEARGSSLSALDGDDAAIGPMLRKLGAFVARVHQARVGGFGWIDAADGPAIGIFDRWRDYVLLNLDEHVGTCVAIGAITPDEARRVESAFAALDSILDSAPPALLHGDLGNHNVFHDDGKLTALIDWEDCLAGDPAFDVAFWATFHPERRHPLFLEGYRSAATLPDDFEARFWLYFLRIALSKTVHRHRFGYADRPGRPPASRRIGRALEALDALSVLT